MNSEALPRIKKEEVKVAENKNDEEEDISKDIELFKRRVWTNI